MVDILLKVAGPLISVGGKALLKRITDQSPISNAIQSTSDVYDDIENLSSALKTWCESEEFWELFERIFDGERNITDSDVVTSFVDLGEFHMGEETQEKAEEVIRHFFVELEQELLRSSDGLGVLANRVEVNRREVLTQGANMEARLHAGMTDIKDDLLHQKTRMLELLLGILTTERIEDQVLEKFTRLLAQKFVLVPFLIKPILEFIRSWRQQNVLKKGIPLWTPEQR